MRITHCLQGTAQRFALPALGRGRRSRPTRKMIRRRKLLGMCAESPASGARFVGRFFIVQDSLTEKRHHCQHAQVLHTNESFAITKT